MTVDSVMTEQERREWDAEVAILRLPEWTDVRARVDELFRDPSRTVPTTYGAQVSAHVSWEDKPLRWQWDVTLGNLTVAWGVEDDPTVAAAKAKSAVDELHRLCVARDETREAS